MNNFLHPHWASTDASNDDVQDVPVRSKGEKNVSAPQTQEISRKPAALLGMAIASAIGFSFVYDAPALLGSIQEGHMTVTISEEGLEPVSVTVQDGMEIQWTNEQLIPHILQSDTLCNTSDECLYTPTIFKDETVTFEITSDIPSGTYEYISATSADIVGEIIVTGGATADPTPAAAAVDVTDTPVASDTSDTPPIPSPFEALNTATEDDAAAIPSPFDVIGDMIEEPAVPAIGDLPREEVAPLPEVNEEPVVEDEPVVDTTSPILDTSDTPILETTATPALVTEEPAPVHNAAPAPSPTPTPIPQRQPTVTPAPTPATVMHEPVRQMTYRNPNALHSGAPLPFAQPQTGPGAWTVTAMSMILFWYWLRKKTLRT